MESIGDLTNNAFERPISKQATLEGQISDEQRKIASLVSAVSVRKRIFRAHKPLSVGMERQSIRRGLTWLLGAGG